MRSRGEFAAALLLDVLGAALALLVATRHWQRALIVRPRPLADQALQLTGRSLDATPSALAVVALAGAVAIVATRGAGRRLVGVVLALAGAALVWRSLELLRPVSVGRARSARSAFGVDVVLPGSRVEVVAAWPWLSACCAVAVAVAGVLVALRGHRWQSLSARYDAPSSAHRRAEDAEQQRTRADAALWQALDEGDDPTRSPKDH